MRAAGVPASGQLFEMNDELMALYGFHPFYLSTATVDREATRRALLYGVKELLFCDGDTPRRLKFILCYVLSSGRERRRAAANGSCAFETRTASTGGAVGGAVGLGSGGVHAIPKHKHKHMNASATTTTTQQSLSIGGTVLHNGHSINSVYALRTYDSLSIMSAHAAFLACRYGAKPSELVAAVDEARVRAAMDKYSPTGSTKVAVHSIGFPLPRRDCAAVLLAHALVKEEPMIGERDLQVEIGIQGKWRKRSGVALVDA